MILEIDINEQGNNCVSILNKNSIKYIYGFEKIRFLKELTKENYKNVKIINNTICFEADKLIIKITNYNKNNKQYIEKIIENAKKVKREERKEQLNNKKINRNNLFKRILLFNVSVIMLVTANGVKQMIDEKNENNSIVYAQNFEKDKDNQQKIMTQNNQTENIRKQNFNIETYDRTKDEKFIIAKQKYYETIKKISTQYGIDPNIMLAIATQERGIHSSVRDKCAIGLMQIELSIWDNKELTVFNYEKNNYETVYITESKLGDLEFNIKVGCMIFRKCFEQENYNLPLAIQTYNYGPGSVKQLINYCEKDEKITENDVYNDEECKWRNYRELISSGDKEYLEHVLSYVEDKQNIICKVNNKTPIKYCINQKTKTKTII